MKSIDIVPPFFSKTLRASSVIWISICSASHRMGHGRNPARDSMGIDRTDSNRAFAIVDPDGVGPRVFSLKVPEGKSAKNRMHLDVRTDPDQLHALNRPTDDLVPGTKSS
jgi:hypothetical protein